MNHSISDISTMSQSHDAIQTQLQALRAAYCAQLPARIAEIETAWQSLRRQPDTVVLQELHRKVHSMAGSAGTFGLPELGQAARAIEQHLKALLHEQVSPSGAEEREISAGITMLHRLSKPQAEQAVVATARARELNADAADDLVYLLEEDPEHSLHLPEKLAHFGYRVESFSDRGALTAALRRRPAALIMDFRCSEVQAACSQWLSSYQAAQDKSLPVLFVAPNNGFAARLEAVRAGGYAYLSQPADIAALIDRLDALTARKQEEPYRVLVVDDEIELAQHYALTLSHAGIKARVVTDVSTILDYLEDFQPDVVLMDLYMLDCDGMELARLIRQDLSYVSTPIVFLSSETDPDKQFSALMTGADDFLTKPIEDRHLISVVNSRAQRARALEAAMSRDSLTGLLKHTKIKEQLYLEVQRTKRSGGMLGFAMLDIDHFKKVNDTYGHPVGDRVIKSLAFLLRQRLRGTDLIGRYGGEEFAVILPGTATDGAVAVLENIREAFAAIEFDVDGKIFTATLSVGVITCEHCQDAASLIDQADAALYEAKEAGRNRIVAREI